jgi:hypothetical protein
MTKADRDSTSSAPFETNVPDGPPPPYETSEGKPARQPGFFSKLFRSRNEGSIRSPSGAAFRPAKNLELVLPNPEHVKCRCGKHVDTTRFYNSLPKGHARCRCGYIVSSTGYACHPEQFYASNSRRNQFKCSCGADVPKPRGREIEAWCPCGAAFKEDGSGWRYCQYHEVLNEDGRNVKCSCGRYVDTTVEWTIRHKRYGFMTFSLPFGVGRCECGMDVRRDGIVRTSDTNDCYTVLSKKPTSREDSECTCAYYW